MTLLICRVTNILGQGTCTTSTSNYSVTLLRFEHCALEHWDPNCNISDTPVGHHWTNFYHQKLRILRSLTKHTFLVTCITLVITSMFAASEIKAFTSLLCPFFAAIIKGVDPFWINTSSVQEPFWDVYSITNSWGQHNLKNNLLDKLKDLLVIESQISSHLSTLLNKHTFEIWIIVQISIKLYPSSSQWLLCFETRYCPWRDPLSTLENCNMATW